MKFEDDLTEFIYSLISAKKPIEKTNTAPFRYTISKKGEIVPIEDNEEFESYVIKGGEELPITPDYLSNKQAVDAITNKEE